MKKNPSPPKKKPALVVRDLKAKRDPKGGIDANSGTWQDKSLGQR